MRFFITAALCLFEVLAAEAAPRSFAQFESFGSHTYGQGISAMGDTLVAAEFKPFVSDSRFTSMIVHKITPAGSSTIEVPNPGNWLTWAHLNAPAIALRSNGELLLGGVKQIDVASGKCVLAILEVGSDGKSASEVELEFSIPAFKCGKYQVVGLSALHGRHALIRVDGRDGVGESAYAVDLELKTSSRGVTADALKNHLTVLPDGKRFIWSSLYFPLFLIFNERGEEIESIDLTGRKILNSTITIDHRSGIRNAKLLPDGRIAATLGVSGYGDLLVLLEPKGNSYTAKIVDRYVPSNAFATLDPWKITAFEPLDKDRWLITMNGYDDTLLEYMFVAKLNGTEFEFESYLEGSSMSLGQPIRKVFGIGNGMIGLGYGSGRHVLESEAFVHTVNSKGSTQGQLRFGLGAKFQNLFVLDNSVVAVTLAQGGQESNYGYYFIFRSIAKKDLFGGP